VVTASVPGFPVGCGEQRVGLLRGEVADDGALAAPGWDGQHLEQRVDGGQPGVPRGVAVPPVLFQVRQELPDQGCVEVGEAEPAGRLRGLVLREREEQLARVAVGRDRVWAGLFLPG
jgi:hypothetical protein